MHISRQNPLDPESRYTPRQPNPVLLLWTWRPNAGTKQLAYRLEGCTRQSS
jgi:hypothetical protein